MTQRLCSAWSTRVTSLIRDILFWDILFRDSSRVVSLLSSTQYWLGPYVARESSRNRSVNAHEASVSLVLTAFVVQSPSQSSMVGTATSATKPAREASSSRRTSSALRSLSRSRYLLDTCCDAISIRLSDGQAG